MPTREDQRYWEQRRFEALPFFPDNISFDEFKGRIQELRDDGKNTVIASVEEWVGSRYEPSTNKGFVLFLPVEQRLRALILTTWKKHAVEMSDLSQQQITFSGYPLSSFHFTNICMLQDATQEYFEMGGFRTQHLDCLGLIYEVYKLLEHDPLQARISQELARCPVIAGGLPAEIAEFEKSTFAPALAKIAELEAEIEKRRKTLKPAQDFIAVLKEQ